MKTGCLIIAVLFVITVCLGLTYLYWLFAGWLVDDVWQVGPKYSAVVKVVMVLFIWAVLGALGRIGKKD